MAAERFAVFGIGRPRSAWFAQLGQWSVAGTIPIDFVRCLTVEEFEARLAAGQACSALIADASAAFVDRDTVATARDAGVVVVLVAQDGPTQEPVGVAAGPGVLHLRPGFGPDDLMDLLRASASPVGTDPGWEPELLPEMPVAAGALIGVCGSGGSGTSSVAAGVAQVLSERGPTLLVDACLRADQGLLHDVDGTVPGLAALVDAHRRSDVTWPTLASHLYLIAERGYHLLTGLRRPSGWTALRPQALGATLTTLLSHFRWVVCDTDADFDGESETGSADVEDRNVMARTILFRSDAMVLVANPQLRSVHWAVRALRDLDGMGVHQDRLRVVLNRAGRRSGREITSCLTRLRPDAGLPRVLALPERSVEQSWRDGSRLPDQFVAPLRVLGDVRAGEHTGGEPVRVNAGELGLLDLTGDDPAVSWG